MAERRSPPPRSLPSGGESREAGSKLKQGLWWVQNALRAVGRFPLGKEHMGISRETSGLAFSPVQFSRSVVSNSLWPRGLQHARLPCPSLSRIVCSNSCPLSGWCLPLGLDKWGASSYKESQSSACLLYSLRCSLRSLLHLPPLPCSAHLGDLIRGRRDRREATGPLCISLLQHELGPPYFLLFTSDSSWGSIYGPLALLGRWAWVDLKGFTLAY